MSEWLNEHIQVGGRNPKATHARDLIQDHNAPLRAPRPAAETTNSSMARGSFLYADETYGALVSELRLSNPQHRYSQPGYYNLGSQFIREFHALSDHTQADYNQRARTPGFGMGPTRSAAGLPSARPGLNMDCALFA